MGKRVKKREVMGVTAEYGDSAVWVWEVRNRTFNLIDCRRVIEIMPDGSSAIVGVVKAIDEAIAYTVGYTQSVFDAPVPVVSLADQGPTMFDNLKPSDN